MKKISRDTLKKIMGGNEQLRGCYLYCCADIVEGGQCSNGMLAVVPIETCAPPAPQATCFGGTVINCQCFGGPHVP